MPAGRRRFMLVSGGGARPSLVASAKLKEIVVEAPSRSGENPAFSVATSFVPIAAGAEHASTSAHPTSAIAPHRVCVSTLRLCSVVHPAAQSHADGVV